jgi:hypothetical protein
MTIIVIVFVSICHLFPDLDNQSSFKKKKKISSISSRRSNLEPEVVGSTPTRPFLSMRELLH